MGDIAEIESDPTRSGVPSWDDRHRAYSAMHHRSGRIIQICFIPNTGTHDRYLPLADLRLIDPAKDGTELILEFSAISVLVTGRFLRRVADEIATGNCAGLEAFDGDRRDMPDDPAAPFIESIRFLLPQQGADSSVAALPEQSSNVRNLVAA